MKNIIIIFFLILCFFTYTVNSQNNSIENIINLDITNKDKIGRIDLFLAKQIESKNDSICFFYHDYAYWLYKNNLNNKAIKYNLLCLDLVNESNLNFKQKILYYLGVFYVKNNELEKSKKKFERVIDINYNSEYILKAYKKLAFFYKGKKDFKNSIKYFNIALKFKDNNTNLRNLYFNISNLYLISFDDKKNILKGLAYVKKADSLANLVKTSNIIFYKIKFEIASFYNRNNNLNIEKAVFYYNQALNHVLKINDLKKVNRINLYKGNLYNTSDYKKSIYFLNKVKSDTTKLYETNLLKRNYGITHANFGQYDKGASYFHESFKYLIGIDLKKISNLNYTLLINSDKKFDLIRFIPMLAETYLKYYKKTKDKTLLTKSINYFKLADYVVDLIKLDNRASKSKLFWNNISTDIYGKAIRASYLNNDIETALFFAEKNKVLLLMQDITKQNYKETLDIPEKLLLKETNLKRQLIKLDLYKNKDSVYKEKVDLERELVTFQDSIYSKKRIKTPSPVKTYEIQKDLKPNEVFIEYHISIDDGFGIYTNKENGYMFFITKTNKFLLEINNLSQFKNDFTKLLGLIKKPFKTNSDRNNFKNLSYKVFDKLFPTKKIKNLIKNKKLIIAPDSYLSLLPFETLITQIKSKNLDYLINNCNISYTYSYSFFKKNTTLKNKKSSFLGIAPITFNSLNLTSLTNSKNEITNLNNYFNGTVYTNKEATKNTFLQELPNHNIIHLATHANAQDSIEPWIAFYDKKITLSELYLTKNKASLVVLSGCNTTLGKQEIGEGIMSLTRGFFYGGAQSVVSSLWSVDDTSTSYIMNEFYKNLYKSQTKSEALHNAKLTYLENHSLSELSPHYWASFILLGKDDVVLHTAINWYPYLFGFILLIIIYFIYRNFKKK